MTASAAVANLSVWRLFGPQKQSNAGEPSSSDLEGFAFSGLAAFAGRTTS
jgi:hypothetical protein